MLPAASLVARVRNEADAGGSGCVISPERQELIYNEVCAWNTTRHDTTHGTRTNRAPRRGGGGCGALGGARCRVRSVPAVLRLSQALPEGPARCHPGAGRGQPFSFSFFPIYSYFFLFKYLLN
jgi:hypothetical protein